MLQNKLLNYFIESFTVSNSAMRTSSYAEDYRVRGFQFVHLYTDSFANGSSFFMLDPTACVASNKFPFSVPIEIDLPSGPITFIVYEGTDYTAGAALPYYNPARDSAITPDSTITAASAGTTKGTELYRFTVGSASSSAVATTAGASRTTDPTSLDRTKKYLIEAVNSTGASITANKVYFSWFEIPAANL